MDAYKRLRALGELDPAPRERIQEMVGRILRIVERIAQQQHGRQPQQEQEQGAEAEEFLPQ